MKDKYSTAISIKDYIDNLQTYNGLLDTDGTLLMANRAAIETSGSSYDNVIGKYFPDSYWWSYDPLAKKWVEDAIEKAKKGETVISERSVRFGSHNFIFQLSFRPVFDYDGKKVEYLVAEGQDLTHIKKTENELNKSYKLINSVSYFTGIIDTDGKLQIVNTKILDYFKCSKEDVIGLPFWECSWFTASSVSVKKIKKALNTALQGKTIQAEVKVTTSDNLKATAQFIFTPLSDNSGAKIGVSFEGMIIPESKAKDDLLLNSETMYLDLVTHMNEGLVITNEKNKFIFINPKFCKMLEYTLEELMSMRDKDILDDKNYKLYIKEANHRRTKGKVARYELTFLTKNGQKRHCLLSAFPIIENGLYKGSNITVTDLTELKEKEEALQNSEMMYRDLVTSMNEGLAITDEKGCCTYVNPKLCEMTGFSEDELSSIKINDRLDMQSRLSLRKKWGKLVTGESSKHEITIITKSDKKLPALISVSPVILNGEFKGTRAVITDIKEIKEMEQKLLQAQKMEAIGVLAGGLAHDFNNILQTISGYTQILLLNKKSDNQEFKDLKAIEEVTQKASSLTKQLLIFARKNESHLKAIDLNNEVNKISDILSRTIPKMINIEVSLAEKLKPINADPVQIEQIIINIGLNAAHAMPDGGKLMIETRNISSNEICICTVLESDQKEYVALSISDNGIGMNGETQKHIFEPFFTTKGPKYGTGLGLAMVYGLVENHKGHIKCYSTPGYGTVFTIYFPAIKSVPFEQHIIKFEEKVIHSDNETILLVDDEEPLRRLGNELLKRQGFSVYLAESGEKALEIYKEKKESIDLVILDISMPGMGGYLCFEELKKIDPDIKVIIVTGYSDDGKVKEIIKSGAAGFVGKPYRLTNILNKIREIIDGKTDKQ
ncbi:MAG: PAS domain S-box protein [Proteobacteria bacterium]|nr:PAS domain S-box protein [Pseudomonadota bacterium]